MRILYCNKYNYPFSGTEVYLFELMELMRAQGHEVALFSMADPRGEPTAYDQHFVPNIDFKDFKAKAGWWQQVRQAGHAIYSTDARRRMRAMIVEFRPPEPLPTSSLCIESISIHVIGSRRRFLLFVFIFYEVLVTGLRSSVKRILIQALPST
jgi:hypothetical protein